jgi:hypothetical protein
MHAMLKTTFGDNAMRRKPLKNVFGSLQDPSIRRGESSQNRQCSIAYLEYEFYGINTLLPLVSAKSHASTV